jgi:hypothetical protein
MSPNPTSSEELSPRPQEQVAMLSAGRTVAPGTWSGPGGFRLDIPRDWVGEEGPPDGPDLWLWHMDTGAQLSVSLFVEQDWHPLACNTVFSDSSRWRRVEALSDVRSLTCVGAPDGPLTQAWVGRHKDLSGGLLAIEATYPPGKMPPGQRAVEKLLGGL